VSLLIRAVHRGQRGIPAPVARQLLVGGFLNEVLERLPDPVLVAQLEELIVGRFERSGR